MQYNIETQYNIEIKYNRSPSERGLLHWLRGQILSPSSLFLPGPVYRYTHTPSQTSNLISATARRPCGHVADVMIMMLMVLLMVLLVTLPMMPMMMVCS